MVEVREVVVLVPSGLVRCGGIQLGVMVTWSSRLGDMGEIGVVLCMYAIVISVCRCEICLEIRRINKQAFI